jgi:hypothetical protein
MPKFGPKSLNPREPEMAFDNSAKMAFDMQNPRDISSAYRMGAYYSREQHRKLSADRKAKFIKNATESIEKKLDIVDHQALNNEKFLEQYFDYTFQVERFREKLNIHGMLDVFTVPVSLQDGKAPVMSNTLDLLKTYST